LVSYVVLGKTRQQKHQNNANNNSSDKNNKIAHHRLKNPDQEEQLLALVEWAYSWAKRDRAAEREKRKDLDKKILAKEEKESIKAFEKWSEREKDRLLAERDWPVATAKELSALQKDKKAKAKNVRQRCQEQIWALDGRGYSVRVYMTHKNQPRAGAEILRDLIARTAEYEAGELKMKSQPMDAEVLDFGGALTPAYEKYVKDVKKKQEEERKKLRDDIKRVKKKLFKDKASRTGGGGGRGRGRSRGGGGGRDGYRQDWAQPGTSGMKGTRKSTRVTKAREVFEPDGGVFSQEQDDSNGGGREDGGHFDEDVLRGHRAEVREVAKMGMLAATIKKAVEAAAIAAAVAAGDEDAQRLLAQAKEGAPRKRRKRGPRG
jgi:hypothetical protein